MNKPKDTDHCLPNKIEADQICSSVKSIFIYEQEVEPFINTGVVNDYLPVEFKNSLSKACTYCNNRISGDNINLRHNGDDTFYIYCNECINGFNMFVPSAGKKPDPNNIKCDICSKILLVKDGKYKAFRCADTNLIIGMNCREEYYKRKNSGAYGEEHMGKYSEIPITVQQPWPTTPEKKLIPGDNSATEDASAESKAEPSVRKVAKSVKKSTKSEINQPKVEILATDNPDAPAAMDYNQKLKHVIHALNPDYPELIDNADWIKPDNQLIYPFKYFTNFHVNEMRPLLCDGCGQSFDGNGNYDTAYFVHTEPGVLKVFHEPSCMKESGIDPDKVMDFHHQLSGFVHPIKLDKAFDESEIHQLVFDELYDSDKYKLNEYIASGIPSVAKMKEIVYGLSGQGGGTSRGIKRKYYIEYNNFSVKWANRIGGSIIYKLSPSQLLKILNEIITKSPAQTKRTQPIIIDAQLATPVKELAAEVNRPAATPKKEVQAQISINESYPGGKSASGTYQFLINQIPPVDCMISGFLGHCGVFKNIKPAKLMIGMDVDKAVVDRWSKERPDIKLINSSFLNQTSWVNPKELGKTLVFLDPPYLIETRSSQRKIYDFEFETEENHQLLLEKAKKFPCYVMICAIENEMYDKILLKSGFRKVHYKVQTQAGKRDEVIYMNYPEPEELHDYSFVGSNYRERWNNKKLVNRMIAQLEDMPALRRNMILNSVITNFKSASL